MIETERLILRAWRDTDAQPFHAMGLDPEVMRYIGPPASMRHVLRTMASVNRQIADYGSAFWAVERRADGAFIGFCGIKRSPGGTPIAGRPEIGWRLAREAWGQGFALEAARASLAWAWAYTDEPQVAVITVPANRRSWGLMERLGMIRDPDGDFDHPEISRSDPLCRHLTYRIARPFDA